MRESWIGRAGVRAAAMLFALIALGTVVKLSSANPAADKNMSSAHHNERTAYAAASSGPPPHSIAVDMQPIMQLLSNREKVNYVVTFIPGGVRTITTSKDPKVADTIRTHSWEMKARMDRGDNIRPTDPLFQEIFRRHAEITVRLRNIAGGVEEDETSQNPQVVLLIRAHTQVVEEFIREGLARARRPSPLPTGYRPAPTPSATE